VQSRTDPRKVRGGPSAFRREPACCSASFVAQTIARAAPLALIALLAACAPMPSPASSTTSKSVDEPSDLEKELASNSPFAALPEYEKPSRTAATAPTTKVAQRGLLDDAVWHAAVDKAHEGLAAFVAAGQLRDQENEEWRAETQRGKQLLSDALDATWEIENKLENDPARARTHEAVMLTRAAWNRKLREAGKIVRG
jgi:hypothetical protein